MNAISRGIRNAFRNSVRTFSIVLILGLSIGLALAMLVARASVQDKIKSVKSTIGNTISIAPAGLRGFQGGGELLTTEQIDKVAALPHVTKVTRTLNDRLTTDNSSLQSAIEPGSFGTRSAGNSGVGFRGPEGGGGTFVQRLDDGEVTRTFTPPVMVTGTNDVSGTSAFGGDNVTFTSGQAFDPATSENVAVVGKALAEKNSLQLDSTFTAYNQTVKVVGIYDGGNVFANSGLVMPLTTLQKLAGLENNITSASATVDSLDNIEAAVEAVKSTLGSTADITSNQDVAKQAIEPLESVKTISSFSLIGAIAAGAVIILLTMVMIVRERRREIGVFKAIGASNLKVMFQFMSEAVTLTVLALLAGLAIGSAAASPVTNVLVKNSTSTTPQSPQIDTISQGPMLTVGGGGLRGGTVSFRNFGGNTLANARSVKASVGLEIIAYGIGTAFVIAIIGSAIPALLISKIRPAEVMRAE